MGHGASTPTSEVSAEVARLMKIKFEELGKIGLNDLDIHQQMTAYYEDLVKKMNSQSESTNVSPKNNSLNELLNVHSNSNVPSGKPPQNKKPATRRRSFGQFPPEAKTRPRVNSKDEVPHKAKHFVAQPNKDPKEHLKQEEVQADALTTTQVEETAEPPPNGSHDPNRFSCHL
jgi:hypothetical protein